MNPRRSEPGVSRQRITLALDALNCEAALIETAAALATVLGAELDALFVEDADIYAVAGLPITQEISLASACAREISEQGVTESVRALVREAERHFRSSAGRGRFEVKRARRSEALGEACGQVDLVLLLPAARSLLRSRLPVTQAMRVRVLCDSTPGSSRALDIAARLARRDHSELELLATGAVDEALLSAVRQGGITVHRHELAADSPLEDLLQSVNARPGDTLVLAADLPVTHDRERLLEALSQLRCQVLLVG
jgi:hypothetical protein